MRMASGSYEGPYTFQSRFEEGEGTNPEELIPAAHAGCFSMALSVTSAAPVTSPSVETTATVHIDEVENGFQISRIVLESEARVPGIEDAEFQEVAEGAKKGCPVSQALAAVPEIDLDAKLAG